MQRGAYAQSKYILQLEMERVGLTVHNIIPSPFLARKINCVKNHQKELKT